MEWKQHTYTIAIKAPLSVRERWSIFLISRAQAEWQDIALKKMYSDVMGEPVYHHGNKV